MIAIIVAYTKNSRVIGNKGCIPWNISADKKRFMQLTSGNAIIMGRKTFESIGHALENRLNIVVTSKKTQYDGCSIAKSRTEAIKIAKNKGYENIFICGGERLYRECFPLCDILYLTEVKKDYSGDRFFPKIDLSKYEVLEKIETVECDYLTLRTTLPLALSKHSQRNFHAPS